MKTFSHLTLALLLPLFAAFPATALWDDCDVTAPREATVDAAGASRVEIEARAGSLRVEGRDDLARVEVEGTACSDSESRLEEIQIRAERRGDRVRIVAEIPDGSSPAALDLVIRVPAGIPLEIDDSSGSAEIRHVAAAEIEDSSGSLTIENVAGTLKVRDSSGSIEIEDVRGEVWIDDSSGSIDVRRAAAVTIDNDGSGSISIDEVDGDVVVRRDGSGSISVSDVGGDFIVDRDGSGGIDYRRVAGRVSVPADD